jgi:hypothetical protein
MGHYAKVLNGIVQQVIVAEVEFFDTFVDSSPGEWIQTSYNTRGNIHYDPDTNEPDGGVALRGNYAGIGFIYDGVNDVFYPPKPYDSWSISVESNWLWTAPVAYPTDSKTYFWDENTTSWIEAPIQGE